MTSANIRVRGRGAGGPDLAQDTGEDPACSAQLDENKVTPDVIKTIDSRQSFATF